MNKLAIYTVLFVLAFSFAYAQIAGNDRTDTGSEVRSQERARVTSGEFLFENGKQLTIREEAGNRISLDAGSASAKTNLSIIQERVQNRTRLLANLSNGRNAEIKIMPNTASEVALVRLRLKVCTQENNCTIVLKEVGQGNQTRAAYEVQAEKQARVLGLFRAKMVVRAQVDAENGQIIRVQKPWWAFLASENQE